MADNEQPQFFFSTIHARRIDYVINTWHTTCNFVPSTVDPVGCLHRLRFLISSRYVRVRVRAFAYLYKA